MRDHLTGPDKLRAFERVNNRLDYLIIAGIVGLFVLIMEVI